MLPLDIILTVGGGLLAVAALVIVGLAWQGETRLEAIKAAPTLSVAQVAERHRWATYGAAPFGQPVEVVGTVECDAPLQAPYSETLCVAFDYNVNEEHEQHYRRPGSIHTHEVEFGGRDAYERRAPRFFLRDATGRVAVDPTGANLDMVETVSRYEQYTGLGGNEHEIYRTERTLPLGNRVYVLGYLGNDAGAPVIGRHPSEKSRPFLISHKGEAELKASVGRTAYGMYLAAIICLAGAVACFLAAYML
jgi:hypothetical protein